jgi:hypothetical protein
MGEEKLQKFINYALKYMSNITLPCKRFVALALCCYIFDSMSKYYDDKNMLKTF